MATPPKKIPGRDLYRARYTDANGKQKSVYDKDYNECRKKWIEALSNKDKGLNFDAGRQVRLSLHPVPHLWSKDG